MAHQACIRQGRKWARQEQQRLSVGPKEAQEELKVRRYAAAWLALVYNGLTEGFDTADVQDAMALLEERQHGEGTSRCMIASSSQSSFARTDPTCEFQRVDFGHASWNEDAG